MITETQEFLDRFRPPKNNSHTSCVLILFIAIMLSVSVVLVVLPMGVPLPLLLYQKGRGYKEGNQVDYNIISIKTPSLLTYFRYIYIDIIIYVLESKS
jgi:hypothetical protein